MAPLVVIRSGSKYVEYRESRAEWMRLQQLKLHDSAAESRANSSSFMGFGSRGDADARARADDDNQQEEQLEQEEQVRRDRFEEQDDTRLLQLEQQPQQRRSRHFFRKHDSGEHLGDEERRSSICGLPMELSTDLYAQDGMRGFSCADCGNMVADRDDVVAKTFFGRTGKAFLMNNMFNICTGAPRNRYLMTGMHTISDVCCSICDSVLGWKYIKAMEAPQKYKEGKFILEKALVQDDSEEKEWQRH